MTENSRLLFWKKIVNKIQEIIGRQFNELRNQINEENEYFTKNIEIFKKAKRNSIVEEFNKK